MKRILVFVTFLSFAIVSLADISGTCGDNLTWRYVASTKTLNISGSGEMEDYYLGGNLVNQVQTKSKADFKSDTICNTIAQTERLP
jgi:hypothetical protein